MGKYKFLWIVYISQILEFGNENAFRVEPWVAVRGMII